MVSHRLDKSNGIKHRRLMAKYNAILRHEFRSMGVISTMGTVAGTVFSIAASMRATYEPRGLL